jgi:hypothetical protein
MDKIPEINPSPKKNTNAGRFLYNLGPNPFDESKEPHIQKDMENAQILHQNLESKSNKKEDADWGYFGASMGLCGDLSPNLRDAMIKLMNQKQSNKNEK